LKIQSKTQNFQIFKIFQITQRIQNNQNSSNFLNVQRKPKTHSNPTPEYFMCIRPIRKNKNKHKMTLNTNLNNPNFNSNNNHGMKMHLGFDGKKLISTSLCSQIYHQLYNEESTDFNKKFILQSEVFILQTDINEKMRAVLIDWLIEVHLKFRLLNETLFLTIALIDRYLIVKRLPQKDLQLLGITALWLASK
jgi:hypothetical protein